MILLESGSVCHPNPLCFIVLLLQSARHGKISREVIYLYSAYLGTVAGTAGEWCSEGILITSNGRICMRLGISLIGKYDQTRKEGSKKRRNARRSSTVVITIGVNADSIILLILGVMSLRSASVIWGSIMRPTSC